MIVSEDKPSWWFGRAIFLWVNGSVGEWVNYVKREA